VNIPSVGQEAKTSFGQPFSTENSKANRMVRLVVSKRAHLLFGPYREAPQ
jgi:hypothetical protein